MMRINSKSCGGGLRYLRCPDCGGMHDKYNWPGNHRRPDESLAAPQIVSDTMGAVQSQASGKIYDSKSELRKEYKQLGMVEVGNDPARLRQKPKHKPDRKDIKDSLQKATARFKRGERTRDELKFK